MPAERARDRQNYTRSELVRAAYMAGSGASLSDIGDALGVSSAAALKLLARMGCRPIYKHPTEVAFHIVLRRESTDIAGRYSAQKNLDPVFFLGKLANVVLADKDLMKTLMEKHFK